jgi:hypothetical protein
MRHVRTRHLRTLTLCLLAAFALTAIAATTASAEKLPAWGQCEPTESGTGGRYADAACTQPVKKVYGSYPGGFEWHPLGTEKHSSLEYEERDGPQPVDEATITLHNGQQIVCEGLAGETQIVLNGPHVTTKAPHFEFGGCHDSEGECHTTDTIVSAGIGDATAWYHGAEEEPGTWDGTTSFIEGKTNPSPVVGILYKTEHPREPFLQQIDCEGEAIHAIAVGGDKSGEELTVELSPVNTMSKAFTGDLRQSGGVQLPAALEGHATKPIEALVNAERWETIGFEATMLFPATYAGFDNAYNDNREELELKATP